MGRSFGFSVRVVAAALALVLVVLKAAAQVGWISGDPTIEFWIIVAAGAVVFTESIRGAVQINRLPRRKHRQRQLEKAVLASLKSIAQVTHLDLTRLGGSVYTVRPHHVLWRTRQLRRVLRYRLDEYPQGSGVKWSEGKGVVGWAVRDRSPRHFDWRHIAAVWNGPGLDAAAAYAALSEEERMGFSFDEFRKLARKYAEGVAVPIISDNSERILGVFAVDLPFVPGPENSLCRLDAPQVIQIAVACAGLLRDVLEDG